MMGGLAMLRMERKLLYFFAVLFFIVSISSASQKIKAETLNVTRLAGKDRYETAVRISMQGWSQSKYAILARGDSFPDALCASPLAKKYDAPILLTDPKKISAGVLNEIQRLGVSNIIIIGGEGAISSNIEDVLKSKDIQVERIWGNDRYETSVEIAKKLGSGDSIAIATGDNFPDALSISAPAAIKCMPILLTQKNRIPGAVQRYIDDNGQVNRTYIIGGPGVISDAILEFVPEPKRIGGNNRYETNTAVMQEFSGDLRYENLFLAVADGPNGDEFADALAGSVLAAKNGAPVILVYKRFPAAADYFIRPLVSEKTKVTVLGGENAVPESVVNNLLYAEGGSAVQIGLSNPPRTIKAWETKRVTIATDADDAEISAYSSDTNVAVVTCSGKSVTVTGISPGIAVITVEAKKQGRSPGSATFLVSSPVHNVIRNTYFDTVQSAIDYAYSGDTIRIAPGVYYEHLNMKAGNLKIIGDDRDTTIIDATQSGGITRAGIKIQYYSGIQIKNLTVRNAGINATGEASREPYGILVSNSNQNFFDNIRLKSNGTYEMYLVDGSSYNTVQNCIIDGAGVERDGYKSLDGIFSCGAESKDNNRGNSNSGNKFMNNVIFNVVNGISLTASSNSWIMNNEIYATDSVYWKGYSSTGVIISNSSMNLIQSNMIEGSKNGIRLSSLSAMSPYAYAGTPGSNIIRDNNIKTDEVGVKIAGNTNILQSNTVSGNTNSGIWLTDTAKYTKVTGNTVKDNEIGILVDNVSNEIHLNKITGGNTAFKNSVYAYADASQNWWGDTNDPGGKIKGNVNYKPWALDENCTKFN